ncbi:LysR family transcriptional regulator [Acidisoma sp. 7E03]
MSLTGISLDQFMVFVTVAESGSFSAAARRLNRAQSAVTYAVQKLEDQLGLTLFDRSAYRPTLTQAGEALLPRATRIIQDVESFSDQARGIAQGLEPELALVVDAMFPMDRIVAALRVFGARYPTVPTRIFVASMGATTNLVIDGTCALGISIAFASQESTELILQPIGTIRMVAVAATCHPLAQLQRPITTDELQQHVQLVLTDPSGRTGKRDHAVLSRRNWRLADLGAKHTMLLGGLGWGGMPLHMVEADIAAGRLALIQPDNWGASTNVELSMCLIHRRDRVLGPAGRWLSDWLISGKREDAAPAASAA